MKFNRFSYRASRGISLIEVLVSMVIGLVVVGAVIGSFVDSGSASRYQSALGQMNQDAQIGLNMLSREIQLAGYVSLFKTSGSSPKALLGNVSPIFGCDADKTVLTFTNPKAATLACNTSATDKFSAFGVVYEADAQNTVATSGGVPTDCLGNGLDASGSIYIAKNRYFIDKVTGSGASGRPELYCASAPTVANPSGTSQPLLENVDDMQVWYGIFTDATTKQVVRYAKAGKDSSTTGTVNAQSATDEWDRVASVRVCLLMRSAEPVLIGSHAGLNSYQNCDGSKVSSSDGYLRRAYFTTATLRSKTAYDSAL